MTKEELYHILGDSRKYSYFNYSYAENDSGYIEYDKENDRFIYHFNKYFSLLDNEAYKVMVKLYGKRTIDLRRLRNYDK